MCNESVLYFYTWRILLNVFRRVYTRIFIDNYPTTLFHNKRCQLMGTISIKKRGQTAGLIENKASLRLIRKLS